MAATALTGASSPMASSTVTTMVPKQSQGLAASTSGISEVNYNTELGLRRPWRTRWHGDATPAKQGRLRSIKKLRKDQQLTVITMMCLAQSEMAWSSLATVKAVAAELRPVTGKTGCAGRFWPTSATRASRGGAQDQSARVDVARNDRFGSTRPTASGGASRWRSRAEGRNGSDDDDGGYL